MKDKDTPKEQLKRLKRSLGEREKELQCLYGIARIAEKPGLTLDEIYQEVLELLPRSWQYPEVACAQIAIDGKEFKTSNYRETEWKQSADIKVHGMKAGMIVVGYLEGRLASDEGPFLKEERLLIDAIAERLGRITERKQAEKILQQSEEKWRSLVKNVPDIIMLVDHDRTIQSINHVVEGLDAKDVIGRSIYDFIQPESHDITRGIVDRVFETGEPGYYVIKGVGPDGRISWYETRTGAMKIDEEVVSVVQVTSDITERRQMEGALKESEQRYRTLFESAVQGILIVDAKTMKFEYANPAICTMLGYSQEELTKMSVSDIHPKTSLEDVLAEFAAQARGEKILSSAVPCLKKDGTIIYADINAAKAIIDGRECNIGFFTDVTERKKAAEALQKSEEHYRQLTENAGEAIFVVQDGEIKFMNPKGSELSGYPTEELVSMPFVKFIHPEDIDMVADRYLKRLKGEPVPQIYDFRIVRRDGEIRWGEINAVPISWKDRPAVLCFMNDITGRKQMEGALRESEQRYRTLFELAAEGILIVDAKTMKFEYANPAICTMLGYSQEELTKMSVSDIHPKTSLEDVLAEFAAQARGEKMLSSAIPCLKKDGTIIYADINATQAIIDGRECNIGFFTDITERKQAKDKIEQAQEALVISNNKLEERDRQNSLLSEMRELLQSCSTIQEVPTIVISYVAKVLPGTDGALFLLSNSRTDLQSVARWGDFPEDEDNNIFAPDACWGLRRGRVYAVEDMKIGPICPHLKQSSSTAYVCLPLIGKGETLGLLHLGTKRSVQEDDRRWNIAELKDTAMMFAEYLSLSIANIKLSEKLASQSIRDTLTGLFNRRYMEETIQREILRAARKETKIGIVMADIDHFKQINDTYGHEAGDEFLMKLADFFKAKTRGSDIACRYGGEEFILILPESSGEDTYKRADYLREEIKKVKVYFRGQLLPSITLSFGIATYPDHGIDTDELIRVADTALYKAKEEGRDRVIVG
jgi:diguanylate cyclase (GGDEF)-like protein/PAS domain S-box-containing protein